jgi:hypothetical protein
MSVFLFCTPTRTRTENVSLFSTGSKPASFAYLLIGAYFCIEGGIRTHTSFGHSVLSQARLPFHHSDIFILLYRERDSNPHVLPNTGFLDRHGYHYITSALLYRRRDSNPHAPSGTQHFKCCVSTIPPLRQVILYPV